MIAKWTIRQTNQSYDKHLNALMRFFSFIHIMIYDMHLPKVTFILSPPNILINFERW